MLVLSRRTGESIVIDVEEGIEITVLEVGANSVRLGIEAPRSIDVWRKEIIVQIGDANKSAAESSGDEARRIGEALRKRVRPGDSEEAGKI
jgi:carbon storage regulator